MATPAPIKMNKRMSRFPAPSSAKKLKFSGEFLATNKENVAPQFSQSLPLAVEESKLKNNNIDTTPSTPLAPSKDLNFKDVCATPPKSPDSTYSPTTPPTPLVHHSDEEDEDEGGFLRRNNNNAFNNDDLDWLKSSDSGFHIKSLAFSRDNSSNGSFGNSGSFCRDNNNGSFCNPPPPINNINMIHNTSSSNVNALLLTNSGSFIRDNGSFVANNSVIDTRMPPPRPVKKTPNNNVPSNVAAQQHSASVNAHANRAPGFIPMLRRRSSSLSSLINPFTPEGRAIKEAKEAQNPSYRKMLEEATLPKNWNAHTIQALIRQPPASGSVYRLLFEELEVIGRGAFGEVTKCRHKVDGCAYAIKRTIRQLRGKKDRMIVLREVYGLAAIQQHDHMVRYFTAWEEDNRIFIQMELCEGGTLQSWVDSGIEATELQLLTVIRHIALGLSYIHSQGLVHLDMKPENIYMKYSVQGDPSSPPIYKIGDLGLLSEADTAKIYMEGDCRYLSRELLQDDMSCLRKSDIFALGTSVYELCRRKPLPRNGTEWAEIRDGILNIPKHFSPQFCELLQSMVRGQPSARPSAEDIVRHPLVMMVANVPNVSVEGQEGCICSRGQETIEILKKQVEFYKNEVQKLQAALPSNPANPTVPKRSNSEAGVQNFLESMQL